LILLLIAASFQRGWLRFLCVCTLLHQYSKIALVAPPTTVIDGALGRSCWFQKVFWVRYCWHLSLFLPEFENGLAMVQSRRHGLRLIPVSIITARSEKGFRTRLMENILVVQPAAQAVPVVEAI
jgi:hypothetical protein